MKISIFVYIVFLVRGLMHYIKDHKLSLHLKKKKKKLISITLIEYELNNVTRSQQNEDENSDEEIQSDISENSEYSDDEEFDSEDEELKELPIHNRKYDSVVDAQEIELELQSPQETLQKLKQINWIEYTEMTINQEMKKIYINESDEQIDQAIYELHKVQSNDKTVPGYKFLNKTERDFWVSWTYGTDPQRIASDFAFRLITTIASECPCERSISEARLALGLRRFAVKPLSLQHILQSRYIQKFVLNTI
ncbi:MAG: hypothetical protein EZS28_016220 [Streblomastix strix]|uniref:Uncharacterized protein n=1 Tax=Streblomastix strix TaxID=222440 RepID=A0A5J4W148_9EUKA|nr:MAG: hypothetical protein EZS28_016220 [Streblomastix strix]